MSPVMEQGTWTVTTSTQSQNNARGRGRGLPGTIGMWTRRSCLLTIVMDREVGRPRLRGGRQILGEVLQLQHDAAVAGGAAARQHLVDDIEEFDLMPMIGIREAASR